MARTGRVDLVAQFTRGAQAEDLARTAANWLAERALHDGGDLSLYHGLAGAVMALHEAHALGPIIELQSLGTHPAELSCRTDQRFSPDARRLLGSGALGADAVIGARWVPSRLRPCARA